MDFLKSFYKEFDWFIWGMLILAVVWFFRGGAQNESAHGGAFIKPLAPIDTGEAYGKYYAGSPTDTKQTLDLPRSPVEVVSDAKERIKSFLEQAREAQDIHVTSSLSKAVTLDGAAGAKASDPSKEYVRLVASSRAGSGSLVSGLTLKGYSGASVKIPQAVETFVQGESGKKADVRLPIGGRAIVTSARSPVGASFRVNMCTGYLDQFQAFTPTLRKDCPSPADEIRRTALADEESCVDFVEELPRCRAFEGQFPSGVSAACRTWVAKNLNYNACVYIHQSDDGFRADEWRLFLDQGKELWQNDDEIIRLIDTKGQTVDAVTY